MCGNRTISAEHFYYFLRLHFFYSYEKWWRNTKNLSTCPGLSNFNDSFGQIIECISVLFLPKMKETVSCFSNRLLQCVQLQSMEFFFLKKSFYTYVKWNYVWVNVYMIWWMLIMAKLRILAKSSTICNGTPCI